MIIKLKRSEDITIEIDGLTYRLHTASLSPFLTNISELSVREQNLICEGEKIAAIKSYRTRTDCSLMDAKTAIEQWSAVNL